MPFKVCEKQCDQCLFSKAKIVSAARKREVLAECRRKDSHFICYKSDDTCCRGFYDANPGATNLMRVAGRLGAVEFVQPSKET